MLFFLIRHGDPIYQPDSLTELGQRQAEALAPRLALYGLDRLYCSTSNRAKMTAAPTEKLLGKTCVELDWCNEKYAYRTLYVERPEGGARWCFQNTWCRKFFQSPEVAALGERWYEHPAFEGTTLGEGIERIRRETRAFLASLGFERDEKENWYHITRKNEERVALFAHQGFGLAFLSCVLGIPYPVFATHFDIGHSGMTVIEFADEGGYAIPKILTMANDSHLYREGLPMAYQNRVYF